MSRLLDVLLTTETAQRARLAQAGVAMLVMGTGVVGMLYFGWAGVARWQAVGWWSLLTCVGMALFYALIRSGWSQRTAEPTLTVPQMVFGQTSGAVAYALLGAGRGAVFPMMMVVLMFGMFVASPRQMRWVGSYAVASFGVAMALMSQLQPLDYPPAIEFGHFLIVATMMPGVAVMAARLARMRQRSRAHRSELSQALNRLRENSTRDELTGLINRRQMESVMAQEHQRCIRSGQTFCLALLDVDALKAVNQAHGYAVGDAVLRAVAQEALRQVRAGDVLARWGGEVFVLLLADTRAPLARGGLERLSQRVAASRIPHGSEAVGVTLSGGLAEHHAGETVTETLARAETALREAKTQGRNRVVVAA